MTCTPATLPTTTPLAQGDAIRCTVSFPADTSVQALTVHAESATDDPNPVNNDKAIGAVAQVPTLSAWALALLGMLAAGLGVQTLRRRSWR